MANTGAKVCYSGSLYSDAGNVVKNSGTDLKDVIAKSTSGVKHIGDVKARRVEMMTFFEEHGVTSENSNLYRGTQASYTEFCNKFFINPEQYLLDEKELLEKAQKVETPAESQTNLVLTNPPLAKMAEIAELLDEAVELLETLNKKIDGIASNAAMIQMDTRENMESLHKIGPKLGEVDKKLRGIDTSTSTIAKTWPGHQLNLAAIKSGFDRFLTARR